MKKRAYLLSSLTLLILIAGCGKMTYHKTRSGLVYKIFPGSGKDSIKLGQIVKFEVTTKLDDSLMFSSYGKLPAYVKILPLQELPYNAIEILPLMKIGDSALTIAMVDTLMRKGQQLPPNAKKGGRILTTVKILTVFDTDSLAMKDYNAEKEKSMPEMMKEQQEQMAKQAEENRKAQMQEQEKNIKSGEAGMEIKTMESWLAAKKIHAQKTGTGTYVVIKQQGTGEMADSGKFISVKYSGKLLRNDSTFQSNSYSFQVGTGNVIAGWDQGLQLFRKGGSGTLYVPGFLAYGNNPPPGSPFHPFEALIFDVTLTGVSDKPIVDSSTIVRPKN